MDSELTHLYDPAKRREYYLKNRQLKGRVSTAKKTVPGTRKKAAPKPPHKTRAQRQAERRKHLQGQVEQLKSRLDQLRTLLEAEVKKAQARSGIKQPAKDAKKSASTQKTSDGSKKLTAHQKAEKAKADKKYRENNPDLQLEDQVKSLTQKIKTIQERIAKMRKEGSIGAKRNSTK